MYASDFIKGFLIKVFSLLILHFRILLYHYILNYIINKGVLTYTLSPGE